MNKKRILIGLVAVLFLAIEGYVFAGDLDSSGVPATAGRMYTIENIYDYLTDVNSAVPTKPSSGFAEPAAGPTTGTMHTLDNVFDNLQRLPATGQTTCYNAAGGAISCSATGQDGELQKGAEKRYSYSDDGTIDTEAENILTDVNTGLMWVRDNTLVTGSETGAGGNQDISTTMTWATALTRSNALTYGGYSDWRLPNAYELFSICLLEVGAVADVKAGGAPYINQYAFPSCVSSSYWSATTYPYGTYGALYVYFGYGSVYGGNKTSSYYVRCVRGGQ